MRISSLTLSGQNTITHLVKKTPEIFFANKTSTNISIDNFQQPHFYKIICTKYMMREALRQLPIVNPSSFIGAPGKIATLLSSIDVELSIALMNGRAHICQCILVKLTLFGCVIYEHSRTVLIMVLVQTRYLSKLWVISMFDYKHQAALEWQKIQINS